MQEEGRAAQLGQVVAHLHDEPLRGVALLAGVEVLPRSIAVVERHDRARWEMIGDLPQRGRLPRARGPTGNDGLPEMRGDYLCQARRDRRRQRIRQLDESCRRRVQVRQVADVEGREDVVCSDALPS